MNEIIKIDDIEIKVIRKRIKGIYFRVSKDTREVSVSIPQNFRLAELRMLAKKNLDWIKSKLAEYKIKAQLLGDNSRIYLWGEEKTLKLELAEKANIVEEKDKIIIYSKIPLKHEQIINLLGAWHKLLMIPKVSHFLQIWQNRLNLPDINFKIRRMKSRWGSCIPAKNSINLNSELAAKPPECLEVVIVHELCHFFSCKHDAVFYRYMDKFYPGWQKIDKLLKS